MNKIYSLLIVCICYLSAIGVAFFCVPFFSYHHIIIQILLLDIIEKVTGSKLDKLSSKYFYNPLGMHSTIFNPSKDFLDRIAPTENDTYFRHRLLQGIVHDENAYILGGI